MKYVLLLGLVFVHASLFAKDGPAPPLEISGKPTYRFVHPRVLFDEGHHNVHFTTTGFRPFAEVLRADGYKVEPIREPFTEAALAKARVLVVVNPRAAGKEAPVPERGRPAFSPEECAAVERWVQRGGSLLLVADHYPIGSAAKGLADRFGVDMSNAFTFDVEHVIADLPNSLTIVFERSQGMVKDHPITRGRNPKERIDVVHTFAGQSLRGPAGSTALLPFSDQAEDGLPPDATERVSAAGRTQALAFSHGKGRVVVFGEAQALTSIISAGQPTGFGHPGNDNLQLVRNVLHWLSRKI